VMVATALGTNAAENPRLDVNADGTVNIQDLILVATHLGETTAAAAPVIIELPKHFTPETLQQVLDLLRTQNDGSLAFQRAIANLELLLLALAPKETALLANYPNPFNPETWIPYQLAKPADVTLRIYTVDGTLVRTLSLGHKAIGTYQSRNRAAYWDGRNAFGEPVASGVYFYTLTAGDFTVTRKMLIRK
ncbi:MAG: T9SS type A sorting domain-containing protein, partial [Candidatus Poribacteria bacterium]|nr:T9SS type A sorting domain-containing protein [Candidatus Poribacteria bacterium]